MRFTWLAIIKLLISFALASAASGSEEYEKFDYFGIEIRMYNVEVCGSHNDIVFQGDGYLCYSLPSKTNNVSPYEHGCLKRVIYESGRGGIIRTGFWFDWNEARQTNSVTLYGAPASEATVGATLYFNEKGYIELNGDDPAPRFITACRLSGPFND